MKKGPREIMTHFLIKTKEMLKQGLVYDSLFSLLGTVIGRGAFLLLGIYVAKILEKETFSEYSILRENMTYFGLIVAFGFGYSSTQCIAKCISNKSPLLYPLLQSVYLIVSITSIISLSVLWLFCENWIQLFELSVSRKIFIVSTFGVIFNGINNVQNGMLSGFKRFRELAQNTAISGAIAFLVSVLLCYKYRLLGALIGLIASFFALCILNAWSIKKVLASYSRTKKSGSHFKKVAVSMIKLTLPITLNESLYMLLHWSGVILLIKLYSLSDVGLFNAALIWNSTVLFIPSALRSVGLSHLSSSTQNTSLGNKKTLQTLVLINICAVSLPIIIVLIFANIISDFYGTSYQGMSTVLRILICTTFFQCIAVVMSQELVALKKNWLLFFSGFIRDAGILLMTIILYLVKFKTNGAVAFSISTLIMHSLYLLLLIIFVQNILNKKQKGANN